MASHGENTAGGPGAPPGPTIAQAPAQLDGGLDGGPALTELRYDRDAIRRGIAQLFTPGELSRFAQRFKVFTDREGSAARGAAQLVRALDTRGELSQLAEAVMREKPEHDWPAPTLVPVKSAQALPAEHESVSDPFAPPPEPPTAAKPGAVKLSEPPAAVGETRAAAPAGGLDGRRAMVIAALVFGGGLALGIGATLVATLRSSADGGEEDKPSRGPAALAMIATEELAKSVDYVSATCELDERNANVREQLAEAFRRCAVTEIQPRPLATTPTAAPVPTAAAPKRRRPRERSIPLRKASPAARCLDKCHGVHQQCVDKECGPEPSSANEYPAYQRCTSRCMTRYSRCRLSCR